MASNNLLRQRIFDVFDRGLFPPKPRRIAAYVQMRRYRNRSPEQVPYLPWSMDIEPTTRCNLKCKMCQLTTWTKPRRDLKLEEFKSILNQVPSLGKIKLQGMGEPLLNPQFAEMVKFATDRKIRVSSTSNGMLLTREIARDIVDARLTSLNFSFDGGCAETFCNIRHGADFDRILANIQTIVEVRGRSRTPIVRLWMVAMHSNIREVNQVIDIARKLSVDGLTLQPSLNYYAKSDLASKLSGERLEMAEVFDIITGARSYATEKGVDFAVAAYPVGCRSPWGEAYISVEGYVVPCCHIGDPDTINFGNINEEKFAVIWNNEKYRDFRRALSDGPVPEACRGCYAFNPQTKALNKLLQQAMFRTS
jgi:radical SAM protein with 4Fe4S-binding SPASM domain